MFISREQLRAVLHPPRANLRPEHGAIPNQKDRLEDYVRGRVCLAEPTAMRVSTARRLFLGDWRPAFRATTSTSPETTGGGTDQPFPIQPARRFDVNGREIRKG